MKPNEKKPPNSKQHSTKLKRISSIDDRFCGAPSDKAI